MKEKGRFGLGLSKATDVLWNTDGVCIEDLKARDVLVVVTNNTYCFKMLDSRGNALVTSNGPHITEPTVRKIAGATFGGSIIKAGWILLGCYLELNRYLEFEKIVLTRVRSICLNGKKMMPLQKEVQ